MCVDDDTPSTFLGIQIDRVNAVVVNILIGFFSCISSIFQLVDEKIEKEEARKLNPTPQHCLQYKCRPLAGPTFFGQFLWSWNTTLSGDRAGEDALSLKPPNL